MDQNLLGSLIGVVKQIPDTAVSEAVSALEQAQEVKDSIPEDYTQLSGDVASLKSAINYIPLTLQTDKAIPTNGAILPANITDVSGESCLCVPCKEGDIFVVSGFDSGGNARVWAFSDTSGNAIEMAQIPSVLLQNAILIAPTNAAYFAFNSATSVSPYVYKGLVPWRKLNNCDDAIKDISDMTFEPLTITTTASKYIKKDGTINDIASQVYVVSNYIDVSGYDAIKVSCSADFSNVALAFYDSNQTLKYTLFAASGNAYQSFVNRVVYVPEGAKYAVLAGKTNGVAPAIGGISGHAIKPIEQSQVNGLTVSLAGKIGQDNTNFLTENYTPYTLTVQTAKYIKESDGSVSDITGDHYVVADNIDVEGKQYVKVSGCATFANGICAFYNSSHGFLSWGLKAAAGSAATIYTNELVSVPAGAKYMAVASMTTTAGNPSAAYRSGYRLKKWTGLKWVCIGDSLTERNDRTTMNYHDYIAQETGITVVNFGKSGSGYKRVGGSGDNFYQRALTIPTDADVVTVFGSGNDSIYMSDADLGTATDTGTDTIGGCVNTCIDNIYSRIPAVQLGIVAPTPWDSSNPADTTSGWSNYVELLRQICRNRSIPFLDLFHESNLRPWDSSFLQYAYSKDGGSGVHPDETGHKLIAGRFRVFVDSLLGITDKPTM